MDDETMKATAVEKRKRFCQSVHSTLETSTETELVTSRRKLVVQRSISLPDVIPGHNSIIKEDVKECPDVIRQRCLSEPGTNSEGGCNINNDIPFEQSATEERKKPKIEKSVSFQDDVFSSDGFSHEGQRRKKALSSGYGTGGSDDSNFNKSEQLDEESTPENSVNSFESITTINSVINRTDNTPILSLFSENSNGSLYLKDEVIKELFHCDLSDRKSASSSGSEGGSPFSQLCQQKLQELDESEPLKLSSSSNAEDLKKEEKFLKTKLYGQELERRYQEKISIEGKLFSISNSSTPSPRDALKEEEVTDDQVVPELGADAWNDDTDTELYGPELEGLKTDKLHGIKTDKGYGLETTKLQYLRKADIIQVERSSNCADDTCDDIKCQEFKRALLEIQKTAEEQEHSLSSSNGKILQALMYHSKQCKDDRSLCKVVWCKTLRNEKNLSDALKKICDFESSLTGYKISDRHVIINEKYEGQFSGAGITEGIDWIQLMALNRRKNVVTATEVAKSVDTNWMVIKRTHLTNYDQQIYVCDQLKRMKSPHIVKYFWVAECGDYFLTCTEYAGRPLKDFLASANNNQLLLWMCHAITGVLHLHKYDIIYLKWAAKNLLLMEDNLVKICDLSCSVLSTKRQSEYNHIKRLLPPTILPPEIHKGPVPLLSDKSDSWGCGCLLYEFFYSKPVFHHLLHEHPTYIWKEMSDSAMPSLPSELQKLNQILQCKCWKEKPGDRASLEDILRSLLS